MKSNHEPSERRFLRNGKLAMHPKAFGGFFSLEPPKQYEEKNGIAIVSVCGPLVNDSSFWCESYSSVVDRVTAALNSDNKATVLSINSPGGDLGGCFESVEAIRSAKAQAGKPLLAFVNGM